MESWFFIATITVVFVIAQAIIKRTGTRGTAGLDVSSKERRQMWVREGRI